MIHGRSEREKNRLTMRCSQPLIGANNLHMMTSTLKSAAKLGSVSGG
jgi:hypothetical protein